MALFDVFKRNKIALQLTLPKGLKIDRLDDRIKFTGTAYEISKLAGEIRKISHLNDGQLAKVGNYIFKVSDYMTEDRFKTNWVELPKQGWNVMASKFLEVTDRYEENPFNFNSCGFTDKITLDIEVEVTDLDEDK